MPVSSVFPEFQLKGAYGWSQDFREEGVLSQREFPWGVREQAKQEKFENMDSKIWHLHCISGILGFSRGEGGVQLPQPSPWICPTAPLIDQSKLGNNPGTGLLHSLTALGTGCKF